MQFSNFAAPDLRTPPNIQQLGNYRVEYKAFSLPQHRHKTPVVFLGGAFQSFTSFQNEVELAYTTHPVILADFPSQGSNEQLAPELSLADYGDLIAQFLDAQHINKVILLGVSYGSAMATLFATQYPEKIERLLLSGITCFRRESLITLLEDSLSLLGKGDMKAFAATAVCNLINHNRLSETEVSPTYRKAMYRQIARLNPNEQQRYIQNTQRLLNFSGFERFPQCPTLIATGEFDNFTLPSENAAVARQCQAATFAVIHNADHLAQFERQQAACTLFHNYMLGEEIESIDGVSVYNPLAYDPGEQRLQSRQRPLEQPFELHDRETDLSYTVRIRNINFSGCELELVTSDLTLNENCQSLYLALPETANDYHVRIMERDKRHLRCLIIQRDLKAADALLTYLQEHLLMVCDKPLDSDHESLIESQLA
ncbi:alpha/beta fold hydrolase [Bacterioplanoides sp.]|uniref:alpha/beta fold hydrolase n=1 Tax=Bacterioplanoides sp. TaxID=2066072 RepID=UPI003AFF9660